MYAVVRDNTFDVEKFSQGGGNIAGFQSAHAARPGYCGSIVVDAGSGRQLTLTLWRSEEEAEAARVALGPVIQRALVPLMAKEMSFSMISQCRIRRRIHNAPSHR